MPRLRPVCGALASVATGIALTCALVPSPAAAQVASALIHEGDPFVGDGETITSLSNSAVNHADGYAVTLNADLGGNTTSYVWGSADGGAGGVLFMEGAYGQYIQTSFESFFGIGDAGEVSYSPSCTDTVSGSTGLDAVWLDQAPIAVEEDVYPNDPNRFWSFGSRPGVTADGVPYWVGGVTDTQGGSTVDRGLFYGFDATPLIFSGDMLAGLPVPVTNISFDYRFSSLGTHYVAEVTLNASSSVDTAIGIDGAVAESNGQPVREGVVIPVESGGDGVETWAGLDFVGITESGDWMLTGNTAGGSTATDEFYARDGVLVLREGDVLDGETLTGAIEGGYLNADGDYALVWDIVGETAALEALIVNDQIVLVENDEVDWDGDGLVDAGTRLTDFTGISSLTLGDRFGDEVDAYFTADVEIPITLARQTGWRSALVAAPDHGGDVLSTDPGEALSVEVCDALGIEGASAAEDAASSADGSSDTSRGTVVLEGLFRVTVPIAPSAVDDVAVGPNAGSLRAVPTVLRDQVTLEYDVPVTGVVSVDVYSSDGRLQRSLVDAVVPSGTKTVVWDGRDDRGASLPAGIYLVRARTETSTASSRVVILE
ncbi:MAG: FlgD immunoglobulin-like domain containing protein [Candidatus Eisenbacteria bacterium]